jgi:hypothetical protein
MIFHDFYILNDRNEVIKAEYSAYADFMSSPRKIVAQDMIEHVQVSTVFLGTDHSYASNNPRPIVFETMIFGGRQSQKQWRYTLYTEALEMHQKLLLLVRLESVREMGFDEYNDQPDPFHIEIGTENALFDVLEKLK